MNVELINITKTFYTSNGKSEIFKGLNLTIGSGEFVSILGPNGCGKTTLFNLIIGLDNDYTGEVKLDHVLDRRTAVGYMMQKDLLLPWKTIYQNIIAGVRIQGKIKPSTPEEVKAYMARFGIGNLIDSYPSRLSGGERQKVALIRTLMLDARIMLLDEPFSAIDYHTRIELQYQIRKLAKEAGKTVLLVTHDIDEAIAVSDRAIIFGRKPNSTVKAIDIAFDIPNRSQISVKQDPKYGTYFSDIWNSLPK